MRTDHKEQQGFRYGRRKVVIDKEPKRFPVHVVTPMEAGSSVLPDFGFRKRDPAFRGT